MTVHFSRAALPALAALLATTLPAAALDPTPQAAVVTPLVSTDRTDAGQPLVLPRENPRVIVSNFEIAPGATLPVHKHPSARYAYVLEGHLRVTNADTGASKDYKAGDFVIEMIDTWHLGANVGDDTVRLVVIDQVEGDAPNTILKE